MDVYSERKERVEGRLHLSSVWEKGGERNDVCV